MLKPVVTPQEEPLSIEVSEPKKTILRQAAQAQHLNTSQFMLQLSLDAAHAILVDQTEFLLPPEPWEAFCTRLDAPARSLPAMFQQDRTMEEREETLSSPVLLTKAHEIIGFDCGKTPLNDFLTRHALQTQTSGGATTYVLTRGNRVIGYYSLVPATVTPEDASGMSEGRGPVPVVLMARLAVDQSEQNKGYGKALLRDALRRAQSESEATKARAFLVYAREEEGRAFYLQFGMEASPTNPRHLLVVFPERPVAAQNTKRPQKAPVAQNTDADARAIERRDRNKQQFVVRATPSTLARIDRAAEREGLSRSAFIIRATILELNRIE